MKIKFKKLHEDAVTPTYGTTGSAGLDLTAVTKEKVYHKNHGNLQYIEYKTGLAISIPAGFVGLLVPRSSVSNYNLSLSNSCGILDSDFRGEISFRFKQLNSGAHGEYNVGDRIGQLVIIEAPSFELIQVDELDITERGSGGYGSTNIVKIDRSQAW